MTETNQPILTAAEEEAERHAGLLAFRQECDDIIDGEDEDDDGPEAVLGAMLTWPKGSRGARIRSGHIHGDEVEEHDDLRRQVEKYQRCVASFEEPLYRLGHLDTLAAAEAACLTFMNQADWIDAYGIRWFRPDFDVKSGTYPETMKAG
ncbi:hypothetical protein [Aureimonas glaciei]|nr:hypothetical protein [Aureimonas glaciei]